ncbi:anthranilate synthase component I family protein [Bacteroidota bacterium]
MNKTKIKTQVKQILADTITPVSVYLRMRDVFSQSLLLESSDYHTSEDSYSFICLQPFASFSVDGGRIIELNENGKTTEKEIGPNTIVSEEMNRFFQSFEIEKPDPRIRTNGFFGYSAYDSVKYFEDINIAESPSEDYAIPEIFYSVYRIIIAINHFQNTLTILENQTEGYKTQIDYIESLLFNRNFASYPFRTDKNERSNMTDDEYMEMVTRGKEHCYRGDVFQIVLSRQFSQGFMGDEFNVYRCLRSINPSPYLFYFDFGSYRIFGSSPEAQLQIQDRVAYIHPIAGTFPRSGDDEKDKDTAIRLTRDKKENAEHIMLVDLARNDLSRNADHVTVENYREIQFYSHVIHMVSKVSGMLPKDYNAVRIMGDTFPAGTLSGAPKYKAMELIDRYENQNRGFYGGGLGFMGFNGEFNHAIMIRSFLSKNNTLYFQAGAGIVAESVEKNELNEVNNKLMALKRAIDMAKEI